MGRPLPGEGTFGYWSGGADFREWGLTAKSIPSSIPARILKYPFLPRPATYVAISTESLSKADYGPLISMLHATSVLLDHCPVARRILPAILARAVTVLIHYFQFPIIRIIGSSPLSRQTPRQGSRRGYFKFY